MHDEDLINTSLGENGLKALRHPTAALARAKEEWTPGTVPRGGLF